MVEPKLTLLEMEIEGVVVKAIELGRGGFGAVFEAEDIKLGRTLAIKVLDPSMAAREELLVRFRREVTLMRELAHERIVRVVDYREVASQHLALIMMEYVAGCSVRAILDLVWASNKQVPVSLAMAIFEQVLEAFAAAQSRKGDSHLGLTIEAASVGAATPGGVVWRTGSGINQAAVATS